MKNESYVKELIESQEIYPFYDSISQNYYCEMDKRVFSIYESIFKNALKSLIKNNFGELVSTSQFSEIIEELAVYCYENPLEKPLANRIYSDEKRIIYDLSATENTCVWIENGTVELAETPQLTFRRNRTFLDQVIPDFDVSAENLPELLKTHINIRNEKSLLLYTLWLTSCFMGKHVCTPILVAYGEKGASKTTLLKRSAEIISPETTGVCAMPKGSDLALRLSNSMFSAFDNISRLTVQESDMLCRSVSGAVVTKRRLYQDTEEVVMDITSIIALNGTGLVVNRSDLMERSILIPMKKIKSQQLLSEKELDRKFEEDLPKILGAIFQLVAIAFDDTTSITTGRKIRLASFYDASIRIGRALGYEDEYIDEVLMDNQKLINKESLAESIVGQTLVQLMENYTEYVGSVTDLLWDLKKVGEIHHVDKMLFPKAPNQLSRKLGEIRSNLEAEYGIRYEIVNIGTCKEIRITKKDRKTSKTSKAENSV